MLARRNLMKNAGMAAILTTGVAPAVHAQAAIDINMEDPFSKKSAPEGSSAAPVTGVSP